MEVAHEFEEVRFLLHHNGIVAVLEKLPDTLVSPVEGPGVSGEEHTHTPSQGPLARPEQEVRVVREQMGRRSSPRTINARRTYRQHDAANDDPLADRYR